MIGIICVDKPQEFTSFDVVAKMRGICGIRKVGHGGTLDPMATGVLPIFVGRATKALDLMPIQDKAYTAQFRMGIATDTQDITGTVTQEKPANFTKEQIEQTLQGFQGDIMQLPPMYSAVWVDGVRLYDMARQGKEVERAERPVVVHSISLLSFDESTQEGEISVFCGKGTYMRTIIHDMGQRLGSCAVMTSLRRTETLGYNIDQCYTFEQLQVMRDSGELEKALLPIESAFMSCPQITLSQKQCKMFKNGVKLDTNKVRGVEYDKLMRVVCDDEFIGLATADKEKMELIGKTLFSLA